MLALLLLLVQSPVTVQLNHDQFAIGDHARVYVESDQDGHLVVLHADPEGRIRVLFPLDPSDDDFIRGGRRFEIRGRADRDAFQIEALEGSGIVFAAVSTDPLKFDAFVHNDHWDFRALGGPSSTVREDPLAKMLDIVQRMSGDSSGRFEYDAATYVVRSNRVASRYGYGGYGYGYGWDYPYHFGLGFYDPFCFDPFWGWANCLGYGYRFGFGYGYPFGFGVGVTYSYGFGRRFPYTRYRPFAPMVFKTDPSARTRYTPVPTRPRGTSPTPMPTRSPSWRSGGGGGSRPSVSRGWSGPSSRPSGRSFGGGGRRH
jgi:hypothetical protein